MNKELQEPIKTVSALDVAHYLLSLDPKRKFFNKKDGNMRLNTMLHIMQILHYAKYQKELFKEPMLAVSPNFWNSKQEQQKILKSYEKK